jgi:hypothetical protein
MDLDDVALELRTRERVFVRSMEFPLIKSEAERVKAARRLIRHAGREIGAKVRTAHIKDRGGVLGFVDREVSEEETAELVKDVFVRYDPHRPPQSTGGGMGD